MDGIETNIQTDLTSTDQGTADALKIKDEQIEKLKQQINDLNRDNAYLKNQLTDKDIELSKTKAILDANSQSTETTQPTDEYIDDEQLAQALMESV